MSISELVACPQFRVWSTTVSASQQLRRSVSPTLRVMLLLSLALMALRQFLPLDLSWVVGDSMSPTLGNGQLFLIDREAYRQSPPAYGDVIVVSIDGEYHVKRVVGTEGERVWFWQDAPHEQLGATSLYIAPARLAWRRKLLKLKYVAGRVVAITVPRGHVFLLGDNQSVSYDSRDFGAVPVTAIRGRALSLSGGLLEPAGNARAQYDPPYVPPHLARLEPRRRAS